MADLVHDLGSGRDMTLDVHWDAITVLRLLLILTLLVGGGVLLLEGLA